ncbi:MAG: recombinase family protein [Actinomycetota bacterium]|nr:recombinase family protein [Actinomycetota bacterium]
MRLLAADEPFQLTRSDGRKPKVATQLLTRRVKQSISEFYIVEMLEKSWDGFAVYTEAGFNVGKPCYGYRAKQVPHPVPVKRAKDVKKTFLEPDPAQAPSVCKIFAWRISERLGYQAIADRLNRDLASYPPPVPVAPSRAVGRWTYSNVRDILTNPKYTGYMTWNRRGRKSRGNRLNPVQEWIWSTHPVHQPLIDMDTWLHAQDIGGHRFGSRSTDTVNVKHPQTKRSYLLRTCLFCGLCGRRMYGKTRRGLAYYVCAPKKGYVPGGHPAANSFWVREDTLVNTLSDFLSTQVFGAYRRSLLGDKVGDRVAAACREQQQRIAALRREIDHTELKSKRAIRSLELFDQPDPDLIRDINERRAQLRHHKAELHARLTEAENQIQHAPNAELLDALPIGVVRLDELPEDLARRLFEALRLELRYDKNTNRLTCRITLTGPTTPAAQHTANDAVILRSQQGKQREQTKRTRMDEEDAISDTSPFPSLECPRQDSNLRPSDFILAGLSLDPPCGL